MKIKYFSETNTLYLEFSDTSKREETQEIKKDFFAELSSDKILALTIENASQYVDIDNLEITNIHRVATGVKS